MATDPQCQKYVADFVAAAVKPRALCRSRRPSRLRRLPPDEITAQQPTEPPHRLTKPNHPWTNGQVERMNRTIKEATIKRYHCDSHDQLRTHLGDFMAAYNFARRLKTLK